MSFRAVPLGMLAMLLFAGAVQATAVDLLIDPFFGSAENTGAKGEITISFSEDGGDDLMTVQIANTTPVLIGSKMTAVGLELPDLMTWDIDFTSGGTSAFYNAILLDVYFDDLMFDDPVSPGWLNAPGGYDLMITSDGNFQGGNPNGAPEAGASEIVVLTLGDTGFTPAELTDSFSTFYSESDFNIVIARFQAVGLGGEGSDKVLGGPPERIPEPATLGLLLVGGLLLGRRKAAP